MSLRSSVTVVKNLRSKYPDLYTRNMTDEEVLNLYLQINPSHRRTIKEFTVPDEITSKRRATHTEFMSYQFKEMFNTAPEWFMGSIAAVTGSDELLGYAKICVRHHQNRQLDG